MNTQTLFGKRGRTLQPIDFPFASWRKYANNYYTDMQVKTGRGYSACIGLEKIKDPVYLLCKKATASKRFVFWSDIDHLPLSC